MLHGWAPVIWATSVTVRPWATSKTAWTRRYVRASATRRKVRVRRRLSYRSKPRSEGLFAFLLHPILPAKSTIRVKTFGYLLRQEVWRKMDGSKVREDSAEADLFKTIIHDLTVGHVI